jgi:hypothetical protein
MIKPDEVKAKLESLGQEHLFKDLSDSDVAKLLDQVPTLTPDPIYPHFFLPLRLSAPAGRNNK